MEILIRILEDVAVIVLTVVILVVALYLVLLALQWGLRLKLGSGKRRGWRNCGTPACPSRHP
jgi:hypothetical protein